MCQKYGEKKLMFLFFSLVDMPCSQKWTFWEDFRIRTWLSCWGIVGRTKSCYLYMNLCRREAWKTIFSDVRISEKKAKEKKNSFYSAVIVIFKVVFGWCREFFHGTTFLGLAAQNSHCCSPGPCFLALFWEANYLQGLQSLQYSAWWGEIYMVMWP